ncbi:MAG TPA: hypothetical protein DEQ30_01565 [Porphyromonadaceae bacterium]|nr:hypothetical protein [Porphyromonadaceae bacterium]
MIINWGIIKACTLVDKQEVYGKIETFMKVAVESLSFGIIAFINEMKRETDMFYRVGYKLLVSGSSPKNINQILQNLLNSSEITPVDYLKKVIFIDYILRVQRGENVNDIKLVLISYLGDDYANHIIEPIPTMPFF